MTKGSNYRKSKPIERNIKFINYLYDNGFIVNCLLLGIWVEIMTIFRAKQGYKLTVSQLKSWKVKYSLFFGKPNYDVFVDDKSLFFKKKGITFKKYLKI